MISIVANKIYHSTEDNKIYSTYLNGGNEIEIVTETEAVYEMTVVNNYLYYGSRDAFKRLSLSTNTIEELISSTSGALYINHLMITASQIGKDSF